METAPLLERVLALPSVPYVNRCKLLPDGPGLYFLIREAEIIYIGISAKSMRQRLTTAHHATAYVRREGIESVVRVAFISYRETSALREHEKAVVREFSPILNFHYVPNALARQHRLQAEACVSTGCWHDHARWPRKSDPPPSS